MRHLDLKLLQCARIIICSELHGNLVFLQFHSFWKTVLYVMVFPRNISPLSANISYQEIAICTSWESLLILILYFLLQIPCDVQAKLYHIKKEYIFHALNQFDVIIDKEKSA